MRIHETATPQYKQIITIYYEVHKFSLAIIVNKTYAPVFILHIDKYHVLSENIKIKKDRNLSNKYT